jgi:hypothetical protein
MKDELSKLAAVIRRNPVECALIAAILLASVAMPAVGLWGWAQ